LRQTDAQTLYVQTPMRVRGMMPAMPGLRGDLVEATGKQITYSQRMSVQPHPFDLADGKFETSAAALRVAFAVGMFLAAALCVWIVLWIWPDYGYLSAAQIVGVALSISVGGVSLTFGVQAVRLAFRAWEDYQAFLEEARTAYLNAYMANDGQMLEQEVRISELNLHDIRDVITLAVYAHLTSRATIGQLRGNLLVRAGSRMTSLGQLSDHGAEQAGKLLERSGVLLPPPAPGAPRRPNENASLEEKIMAVISKWGKE